MVSNTYTPPAISVALDLDSGQHVIMAEGIIGGPAVAGERLLRAEPWPKVQWRHDNEADAERDAATLRTYLAACASGKLKDRGDAVPVGADYWTRDA